MNKVGLGSIIKLAKEHITRRNIALFLLLNFIISNVLMSLPQTNCSADCCEEFEMKLCENVEELSCCEKNNLFNTNYDQLTGEVKNNSCELEYSSYDKPSFIVPKVVNPQIEFSVVHNIIVDFQQILEYNFAESHNQFMCETPPIYKTISTYLI